jgi:transposase InsO family protein
MRERYFTLVDELYSLRRHRGNMANFLQDVKGKLREIDQAAPPGERINKAQVKHFVLRQIENDGVRAVLYQDANDDKVTVLDFIAKLTNLMGRQGVKETEETVMFVQRPGQGRGRGRSGGRGHVGAARGRGRAPPSRSEKWQGDQARVQCYGCGGYGHKRYACPSEHQQGQGQRPGQRPGQRQGQRQGPRPGQGERHQSNFVETAYSTTTSSGTQRGQQAKAAGELDFVYTAAVSEEDTIKSPYLLLDSGASENMVKDTDLFVDLQPVVAFKHNVGTANGGRLQVEGKGTIEFEVTTDNDETLKIVLRNVLYIPELKENLLSVLSASEQTGMQVRELNAKGGLLEVMDTKGRRRGVKIHVDQRLPKIYIAGKHHQVMNITHLPSEYLHFQLGHLGQRDERTMLDNLNMDDLDTDIMLTSINCDTCQANKMKKTTIKRQEPPTPRQPGELIVSDLLGPMVASKGGARYIAQFTDVATSYTEIYALRSKDEMPDVLNKFAATTAIPLRRHATRNEDKTTLQADNGTEYTSAAFQLELRKHNMLFRSSAPGRQEQNGKAERYWRTLRELTASLLYDAELEQTHWLLAARHANYLLNIAQRHSLGGKSAYELLHGKPPHNPLQLLVFGTEVFVHKQEHLTKFEPRADVGVYVGFNPGNNCHRILLGNSVIDRRDVAIKRVPQRVEDAVRGHRREGVDENVNGEIMVMENKDQRDELQSDTLDIGIDDDTVHADNHDSDTTCQKPQGHPMMTRSKTARAQGNLEDTAQPDLPPLCHDPDGVAAHFIVNMVAPAGDVRARVPATVLEALDGPDREKWREAIDKELDSLKENSVFAEPEREQLQRIKNGTVQPISTRWIFAIKNDGTYKARLVARGFEQRPGIDFDQTFSPTTLQESTRTLFAIAASKGMVVDQLDVKTAFQNSSMENEIYVVVPEGTPGFDSTPLRLARCLYGLKQASRQWWKTFATWMNENGMWTRSEADACVYYMKDSSGTTTALLSVYVDDLLICHQDGDRRVDKFVQKLKHRFKVRDLGRASTYLGLDIDQRSDGSIFLSQQRYIEEILKRFAMDNCKPVSTPLPPGIDFSKLEINEKPDPDIPYRSLTGAINYLAWTRPDLSQAASELARFNSCYTQEHFIRAKHVLRYLRGTANRGLLFANNSNDGVIKIDIFSDASFAFDSATRRSRTGFVVNMNGTPILFKSTLQRSVVLSSAEAEYFAMSDAIKAFRFLHEFLNDIKVGYDEPAHMYVDNQPAMIIAQQFETSGRNKHFEVRLHHVRQWTTNGSIKLIYLSTNDMVADMLTKPLTKDKHLKFVKTLLHDA